MDRYLKGVKPLQFNKCVDLGMHYDRGVQEQTKLTP